MATLPFRPPQFSDDVAWLPPWLQSNQSSSLQNVDSIKGGHNQAVEPNLRLSGESGYKSHNIFRLHLSGEDSSPNTLTPCEKVLHFNLHLSTDGGASVISDRAWDASQNDRLNSPDDKALHAVKSFTNPRINNTSNIGDNTSDIKFGPSIENSADYVCKKALYISKNSGPENVEICNTKDTESNHVNDAVELSVAASEALVIREIMQSESISEDFSSAAILDVALRVKQARLDTWGNSLCYFEDTDNTSDILSDLSDSDLEDVYNDVGLSILDNFSSMDPSISRVKDTPMTPANPEREKEVQSEWNQDRDIYFKNRFLARPLENNLNADEAKDFSDVDFNIEKHHNSFGNGTADSIPSTPCYLGNQTSDDKQTNQEDMNGKLIVDNSTHKILDSSLQLLKSGKTNFNRESDGSSCGYQSRWLGGWNTKEGDVGGGKELNAAKHVRKMLINEASFLSESTYVAPDQNSVMNYHQSCSKSREDSFKTGRDALISHDVVKDSNSSFVDSLCSMVPCSISSEIGKSPITINNNDNQRVINADESLKISSNLPMETVQLNVDNVCITPIIRRQTKSLKDYSIGLPGTSPSSPKKIFNPGLEEGNDLLNYGIEKEICNNTINTEVMPSLDSMPGSDSARMDEECDYDRLLAVDQNISSLPFLKNSEKNHSANSTGRHIEDNCRGSDKNKAEMNIQMQDTSKPPFVLCSRTLRTRAPEPLVTDLPIGIPKDDQVCGSGNIYDNNREIPRGQLHRLSTTEVLARKRVRFSDADIKPSSNKSRKRNPTSKTFSRVTNRPEAVDNEEYGITSQEVKERLTNFQLNGRKKLVFQGLNFLLTGFSKKKEQEIQGLLRKNGGMILSDIPTPLLRTKERSSSRSYADRLPVVICSRKLQTTAFLYGCAVNAFLLKAGWAYDSIKAGSVLPPDKYEVLSTRTNRTLNKIGKSISQNDVNYIFVKVGIMLHGTPSFCTKLADIIKHGRGIVYKSLQWLVQSLDKKKISLGVLVVEEDNRATRHLKKYASERKIPAVPASWIVNSLLEGKLLPLQEKLIMRLPPRPPRPAIKVPVVSVLQDWSQEI